MGRPQEISEIRNITSLYLHQNVCQSYHASNQMDLKLKVLYSNGQNRQNRSLKCCFSTPHSFQPLSSGGFTAEDTCRARNISIDHSPPPGCTLDLPSIQRSSPPSTLATEGKQQRTKEQGFAVFLIN